MTRVARSNPARSRAMTLLEVVVATAALASISTLVAALWMQTRDWTRENAAHHVALRVERALTLLDDQWRARIRTVRVSGADDAAAAVSLSAETLEFVTSAPIFFQDWPMARITLRLERPLAQTVGAHALSRVIYTESPVADPASAASRSGPGADLERTIVLLDGAESVRFERWADERDAEAPAGQRGRGPAAGWRAVEGALTEAAVEDDDKTEDGAAAEAGATADAGRARDRESAPLRAGRLVARIKGDPVVWQFIAAPSR